MRKLIVLCFLSLDGVLQGPGGPDEDTADGFQYGGWVAPYDDDDLSRVIRAQMSQQFELLLGRKTYDIWAPYWPQHEAVWPGINAVRKYVASRDPGLTLEWQNSTLLTGDVAAEVQQLKHADGPDLHVYGSGDLAQTLFKHDLVDELWLKIFPLTLGPGKRLFAAGPIPAAFRLSDGQITPQGVIIANYARAGAVVTGKIG